MKGFKEILTENLKGKIPDKKLQYLPSGFQIIGNIALVNFRPELKKCRKDVGNTVLKNFSYIKTVCSKEGIRGVYRKPEIKIIAGRKKTVTVHKENGCLFKLDVSKLMFAKGNMKERARLPDIVGQGETIVDMFAGIGYFSIPIAKKNPFCNIYAIEINPVAVKFLEENCMLNRTPNIKIIKGDCREAGKNLFNAADRVLMGYLPKTYEYLPYAFRFLKRKGIIHYHDVYKENELWKGPVSVLKNSAEKSGFGLEKILYKGIVKSYAPGKFHIVVDAEFGRR
jgi:tRNA wybutosine-synthesizing protein 2